MLELKKKYILVLLPILFFTVLRYTVNFDGLYGQDAYEYLRYSKEIRDFLLTGNNPGDYFWPLFYPIFGAVLSVLTQKTGLALVLISVFSLSISAIYLHKIIALLYSNAKYVTLYIVSFYLLSPYIFKNSMLVMSDMLTVCFIVLSVYFYLKYKQNNVVKHFYFLALFSVSAIMTRYGSAIVVLPFVVLATISFLKQKNSIKHIPLLMVLVFVLFLPHLWIRSNNTVDFLSHQWLQDWSFSHFFKRHFITVDGTSHYNYPNIIYGFSNLFHPRYIFAGLVFVPFLIIKKQLLNNQKIIAFSMLLYGLFLSGIPFQNNRFLLLSFPLIIILFYPVFIFLLEIIKIKKIFYLGVFIILILQSLLIHRAFKSTMERNSFEKEMATILNTYLKTTPSSTPLKLYSFDVDIALQGRDVVFNYQNLWEKQYTNLQVGELILFHPTKFTAQWRNKNPMINWVYFNKNYHLKVIKKCPNGWNLYQVN